MDCSPPDSSLRGFPQARILAAAKSLQSCPTLCDPIDGSLPGSAIPGILQARTLEWVAISFSNAWKWKVKGKLLSHVWLFVTPWTAAHQAPLSMEFSRQEYWSGVLLFPSPGGFLNQGFVPGSPAASKWILYRWATWSAHIHTCIYIYIYSLEFQSKSLSYWVSPLSGQRSLAGYGPWSHTESVTTKQN